MNTFTKAARDLVEGDVVIFGDLAREVYEAVPAPLRGGRPERTRVSYVSSIGCGIGDIATYEDFQAMTVLTTYVVVDAEGRIFGARDDHAAAQALADMGNNYGLTPPYSIR